MNYALIAMWSQVLSSIAFVVVMVWLWIRFLQPVINAAQENNNKVIAEGERHRDEAKAALDELGTAMDAAERDAQLIRNRGEDAAKREFDATVAAANDAGERTLRNARGELDRALAAAREQLRQDLVGKAFALARGDAERGMDRAVNERLVDGFVASLEADRG
jgi:F0F1-type ATP synthase membrane subunit b/b'